MSPELRLRALLTRWRTGGVALLLARELGGEVHARHRQRLATGLAAWPEVQGSFLATWC